MLAMTVRRGFFSHFESALTSRHKDMAHVIDGILFMRIRSFCMSLIQGGIRVHVSGIKEANPRIQTCFFYSPITTNGGDPRCYHLAVNVIIIFSNGKFTWTVLAVS